MRYSPSEISTIDTTNFQIHINIPREDNVISLLNSYLELSFDVLHAATNNRYADINDITLVYLGLVALFKYKVTTSSRKQLKSITLGDIACLRYKILTNARDCDDLSIGFRRDRDTRKRELTNNKGMKGKYHVGIFINDIFGLAQHQLKGTYGLR